jgi:TonB family protein
MKICLALSIVAALLLTSCQSTAPHEPPTLPVVKSQNPPVYPEYLRKAGITGTAIVQFIVTKDGDVVSARVVNKCDPRLAIEAIAAVSQWKFVPSFIGERPVNSRISVPITFELETNDKGQPGAPATTTSAAGTPVALPAGPQVPPASGP